MGFLVKPECATYCRLRVAMACEIDGRYQFLILRNSLDSFGFRLR